MTTDLGQPVSGLLVSSLPEDVVAIAHEGAGLIERLVAAGTHVIDWAGESMKGHTSDRAAGLLLFLHILDLGDGIAGLIRAVRLAAATVAIRALFEAHLGLTYMLAEDVQRRMRAFYVTRCYQRIAWYEKFDSQTDRGKQYAASCAKDLYINEQQEAAFDAGPYVQHEYELLALPHLKDAAIEYERTKTQHHRVPAWYMLDNGPTSVETLAARLNVPATYDLFYRRYSEKVHGTDAMENLIIEGGKGFYRHVRRPDDLAQTIASSAAFTLGSIDGVIQQYAPKRHPEFAYWWRNHGSPVLHRLTKIGIKVSPPPV